MNIILFFALTLLALIFVPQLVLVLVVINLIPAVFLSSFQVLVSFLPVFRPKHIKPKSNPFVSIFIPAYNEPPAILMQTLESLVRLDYDNYEVLVIDNNTKDKSVWKPVETYTQTLGGKFKFFHVDPLSGFKAGALNYLLEHVNPRTQFVAVVDADYIVSPDFIKTALSYFLDEKIALVQFPQHYRNCTKDNQPIADEYRHFFSAYMNMANHFDCVPSTGTVSVYRLDALKKIGGFCCSSLTEDAEAGIRIYRAGYRGVYVDKVVGSGLMPYDLESYRKQKWRWAFGNAQSLAALFKWRKNFSLRSLLGFLLHLTAWHHFNLLPLLVIAASAFIFLFDSILAISPNNYQQYTFYLASFSFLMALIFKLMLFIILYKPGKYSLWRCWKAFLVHMGMTLVYSEAWLTFLLKKNSTFERTNKFILVEMPSLLRNTYKELLLAVFMILGIVDHLLFRKSILNVFVFIVIFLALASVYYVYWKIYPTKSYSQKLLSEAERRFRTYLDLDVRTAKSGF